MMQIPCPHCGPRAQAEFIYERTVDSVVALDASPEDAMPRSSPATIRAVWMTKSGGILMAAAHGWS